MIPPNKAEKNPSLIHVAITAIAKKIQQRKYMPMLIFVQILSLFSLIHSPIFDTNLFSLSQKLPLLSLYEGNLLTDCGWKFRFFILPYLSISVIPILISVWRIWNFNTCRYLKWIREYFCHIPSDGCVICIADERVLSEVG